MPQVKLPAVFEIVDYFAHYATASKDGYRGVEVQAAPFAIRADKGTGDIAREGLRAFRAKGRRDARRLFLADHTEIFAWLDRGGADSAGRGINETNESAKGVA